MRFDLPHSLTVIDLFATHRTFIKLKPWHGVGSAMTLLDPLASDFFNSVTPARRTFGDGNHSAHPYLQKSLRKNERVVGDGAVR